MGAEETAGGLVGGVVGGEAAVRGVEQGLEEGSVGGSALFRPGGDFGVVQTAAAVS